MVVPVLDWSDEVPELLLLMPESLEPDWPLMLPLDPLPMLESLDPVDPLWPELPYCPLPELEPDCAPDCANDDIEAVNSSAVANVSNLFIR